MMNDDDEFFGEETKNLRELKSWKLLQLPLWTGLLIFSSDRFDALFDCTSKSTSISLYSSNIKI